MHECGFFEKSRGKTIDTSRFEARNESPMMRKCEFRMQENPQLIQSKFERSETLSLGPKHSNLSPKAPNSNPSTKNPTNGPI